MSLANLGEILRVLLKHVGEPRARHYIQVPQHVATMVDADATQALGAAEMKHTHSSWQAESTILQVAFARGYRTRGYRTRGYRTDEVITALRNRGYFVLDLFRDDKDPSKVIKET